MFTLVLPALLREPHETLPELHTPALNQLLRYARVQPTAYSRMQLYQTYLCDQLGQPENIIYASPVWQQMGMNTASQPHRRATRRHRHPIRQIRQSVWH